MYSKVKNAIEEAWNQVLLGFESQPISKYLDISIGLYFWQIYILKIYQPILKYYDFRYDGIKKGIVL